MTQPGDLAHIVPRGEDWIARELTALRRELRHRASMWKETYSVTGTLSPLTGKSRTYNHEGYPLSIISVSASVATAPTGADLVIDVLKNGATIYTSATPPTIAAGTHSVTADLPDDTFLDHGDYLTIDITQVGSTVAGSDLTVQVRAS